MSSRILFVVTVSLGLGAAALAASGAAAPAKGTSDLTSPQKRDATVALARKLTQPPAPAALPAELPPLFNPPDFEKPDPDEIKAMQAAGGKPPPGVTANAGAVTAAPAIATDHDVLEKLAAKIPSTGYIEFRGQVMLVVTQPGKAPQNFPIGTKFTVGFDNQDYDLELVSITPPTYTLRYRGEEVTRPIRTR